MESTNKTQNHLPSSQQKNLCLSVWHLLMDVLLPLITGSRAALHPCHILFGTRALCVSLPLVKKPRHHPQDNLDFKRHISRTTQTYFLHSIKRDMTKSSTQLLVQATPLSRFDYCNSFVSGPTGVCHTPSADGSGMQPLSSCTSSPSTHIQLPCWDRSTCCRSPQGSGTNQWHLPMLVLTVLALFTSRT